MVSRRAGFHPRRQLILDLLHERPGLCLRELAREAGVGVSTLRHHVSILIRGGSVWTTKRGLRLLHFPANVPRVPLVAIATHDLDDLDSRLLGLVQGSGLAQKAVLAAAPEVPRATVQHRLNRLVAQGILCTQRQGRFLIYEAHVHAFLPDVGVAA